MCYTSSVTNILLNIPFSIIMGKTRRAFKNMEELFMLNLTGKPLSVTLPISVLKKMGNDYDAEDLRKQIEKMANELLDTVPEEMKLQMEELLPYLPNIIFIPIVIEKMIENNLNFLEALDASSDDIEQTAIEATWALSIANMLPGILDPFKNFLLDCLAINKKSSNHSQQNPNMFGCLIKEISESSWNELEQIGITKVVDKILNMPKVANVIEEKTIAPIVGIAFKTILQREGISEDEFDDEDKAFFEKEINTIASIQKNALVLQTVLSEVLTKAIDENITVEKVMDSFEEYELLTILVKKLIFSEDLSKYTKEFEKVVSAVHTFLD